MVSDMKSILNLILIVAGSLLICGVTIHSTQAQTELSKMSVAPEDSVQAENLRVWLAQEETVVCRFEVKIFDMDGNMVRLMLNRLMSPGYYNLYWDRRDDSGRWVPEGDYVYTTNGCGGNRRGRLKVEYKPGERNARLLIDNYARTGEVGFLVVDSTEVTFQLCNYRGTPFMTVYRDTLLPPGVYRRTWVPDETFRQNRFLVRLTYNGFVLEETIRRPRK